MPQQEVLRLRVENKELHNELAAFDPQFFEEIEDLKYQHGVAVRLCVFVFVFVYVYVCVYVSVCMCACVRVCVI